MRQVQRWVEALLRQRRPRAFAPSDEEAELLRTTVELRAAAPGAAEPRPAFVAALRERLAAERAGPATTPGGQGRPDARAAPVTRRRLFTAAAAAASATTAVAVDRVLLGRGGTAGQAPAETVLEPVTAVWLTVLRSADLPDGGVRTFDAGAVVGFVQRDGGRLAAVSGVCTHQGCRLALDAPVRRLECPCHDTVFALDGRPLRHQLPTAPRPLPSVAAREVDGAIQVLVPPGP